MARGKKSKIEEDISQVAEEEKLQDEVEREEQPISNQSNMDSDLKEEKKRPTLIGTFDFEITQMRKKKDNAFLDLTFQIIGGGGQAIGIDKNTIKLPKNKIMESFEISEEIKCKIVFPMTLQNEQKGIAEVRYFISEITEGVDFDKLELEYISTKSDTIKKYDRGCITIDPKNFEDYDIGKYITLSFLTENKIYDPMEHQAQLFDANDEDGVDGL